MNSEQKLLEALERLNNSVREAGARGVSEPRAATLATARPNGRPSTRTIMVISIDPEGLLFFTNLQSGKGQQLQDNPYAGLCFYWRALRQQVTVEGSVEILSEDRSDERWKQRYRDAALAAWASEQTGEFKGAAELKTGLSQVRKSFSDDHVPRPAHWRGFRLKPDRIEFWQSGWERLRPRELYWRQPDGLWQYAQENP